MRPDFKDFHGVGLLALSHSAKGSTWEEHKYIKRIDGTYYYPDDYEGGRHLPDSDVEKLSDEVIRGNFGNGQIRRDLLGEHYQQIQDRVNEKLLGSSSPSVANISESEIRKDLMEKAMETVAEFPVSKNSSSRGGLDFEAIYGVYRKRN